MIERNPIEDLLCDRVGELDAADAADTAAAMEMAWYGFDALMAAGRSLAASHVDYAVLQRHAEPILTRVGEILRTAPSLPDVKPPALDLGNVPEPPAGQGTYAVYHGLLDVAYALTILLPAAAGHARQRTDRKACREAARLAHHLVNCYEGRLNLFSAHVCPEVG